MLSASSRHQMDYWKNVDHTQRTLGNTWDIGSKLEHAHWHLNYKMDIGKELEMRNATWIQHMKY